MDKIQISTNEQWQALVRTALDYVNQSDDNILHVAGIAVPDEMEHWVQKEIGDKGCTFTSHAHVTGAPGFSFLRGDRRASVFHPVLGRWDIELD